MTFFFAAEHADDNNTPYISCVLGSKSDFVRCDKVNQGKSKYLHNKENYDSGLLVNALKSSFIEFNDKTGNVEAIGTYKEHDANVMKRFTEKQKKLGLTIYTGVSR